MAFPHPANCSSSHDLIQRPSAIGGVKRPLLTCPPEPSAPSLLGNIHTAGASHEVPGSCILPSPAKRRDLLQPKAAHKVDNADDLLAIHGPHASAGYSPLAAVSPVLLDEADYRGSLPIQQSSRAVGSKATAATSIVPSLTFQSPSDGTASQRQASTSSAEIEWRSYRTKPQDSRDLSSLAGSEYGSDHELDDNYDYGGALLSRAEALALSGDYGAGYAEETARANGVDLHTLIRRMMLLLMTSKPNAISWATGSSSMGLPVNLLRRTAPHLRSHLSAMLAAATRSSPPEVALRMCSEFAFDGVHLTLCGFAAALVSDRHNQLSASVPRGYVLTAPRHLVTSTTDAHAHVRASTTTRDIDFNEDDGVWSSSVSLSTLFSRWPHLVRLFRAAKRDAIKGAEALLAADAAGRTEEVPLALSRLYAAFIQGASFSAACWLLRPEGVSQVVSHSPPFLRLLGINDASLRQYMREDPDSVQGDPMLWLHPSNTARRAMASLAAANQGLDTYTFEGLHMRRVGGGPNMSSGTLPTSCSYSPFYAMQTVHIERYPNGAKRMDIVYFSDVVNVRKTVEVSQLHTALTEVEALEQVVGRPDLPHEVSTAMHRCPQSPGSLVSMLSQLDQDSRLRFVKRLCMVLQHDSDPLLQQHVASGKAAEGFSAGPDAPALGVQCGPEAPGAAASEPVPMLNGITHARLQALKERLLQQLGPRTLQVVQAMLMHLVSQAPRQVLFVWEGREYEAAFPYAALRKAALRWSPPPEAGAAAVGTDGREQR